MLKQVERHFGKRLVVTSGYRSPAYNKKVRGAEKSQHMYCAAVDVQLPGVSKWELAKYVRAMPGRGGVGTYCHALDPHRRRAGARLELEVRPPQGLRLSFAATLRRKSFGKRAFDGLPPADNAIIRRFVLKRAHRLAVRTPPFHGGNRGSIPLGRTKLSP